MSEKTFFVAMGINGTPLYYETFVSACSCDMAAARAKNEFKEMVAVEAGEFNESGAGNDSALIVVYLADEPGVFGKYVVDRDGLSLEMVEERERKKLDIVATECYEAEDDDENKIDDLIENKEKIYGKFEDQVDAISAIVDVLDELKTKTHGVGLTSKQVTEYTILMLKVTRSVTDTSTANTDTWLDLANYARLVCRRRTGKDIISELKKIGG